jgi:hypothetical protein
VVSAYNYTLFASLGTAPYYLVVGEVENQGAAPVESVHVNAVFYGADGEVLGAKSDPTEFWHMRPGERAPFSLKTSGTAGTNLTNVKLTVSAEAAPVRQLAPLRLSNVHNRTLPHGNLSVSGEVINDAEKLVRHGRVVVLFEDPEGRIVSVDHAAVTPDILQAGESGSFEVRSYLGHAATARVALVPNTVG